MSSEFDAGFIDVGGPTRQGTSAGSSDDYLNV